MIQAKINLKDMQFKQSFYDHFTFICKRFVSWASTGLPVLKYR